MNSLTYRFINSLDEFTIHENVILKMLVAFNYSADCDLAELGEKLKECDDLTDGGYWLIDVKTNKLYMSDKFLHKFGYDRTDFAEPSFGTLYEITISSDLDRGRMDLDNILAEKSQRTFINNVRYHTKGGAIQEVECSGTVFFVNNEAVMMLGTHKII